MTIQRASSGAAIAAAVIGNAVDIWTAYREGRFGTTRPWLGYLFLLEEAAAAGAPLPARTPAPAAPVSDAMRAKGMWNDAWDPFFALDPAWTDAFMAAGVGVYAGGVFEPKLAELLSIAFDASITHMYAPGTRRHIRAALSHGATVAEIMEVLKLCVVQGVQAANMALPILAEELDRAGSATETRK